MITETALQGHWVRRWIKAPGFEDHTTRVHWMQAGRDYADVRVPIMRPDLRGATCLAELPASTLLQLCQTEGFAGHITLEGDRCTWQREINWHGTPDTADVGQISFDEEGRMIETGVLADYAELWSQNAQTETTALRFACDAYTGILVTTGSVGVLGIGQPTKPSSEPLLTVLKTGSIPENVETQFDGFNALCQLQKEKVVALIATNPLIEGQPVLSFSEDRLIWHKLDFDGTRTDVSMRVERIPA